MDTWTRRVLRQADRVLVIGRAGDDPLPGRIESAATEMGVTSRRELVLLHPAESAQPSGTERGSHPARSVHTTTCASTAMTTSNVSRVA
jgi:hypothetical protein